MNREARIAALRVDIDSRLLELWTMVWDSDLDGLDEETRHLMAGALRIAYSQGYQDALREDRAGQRGALARAHGYTHD